MLPLPHMRAVACLSSRLPLPCTGLREGPPSTMYDCIFDNEMNIAIYKAKVGQGWSGWVRVSQGVWVWVGVWVLFVLSESSQDWGWAGKLLVVVSRWPETGCG